MDYLSHFISTLLTGVTLPSGILRLWKPRDHSTRLAQIAKSPLSQFRRPREKFQISVCGAKLRFLSSLRVFQTTRQRVVWTPAYVDYIISKRSEKKAERLKGKRKGERCGGMVLVEVDSGGMVLTAGGKPHAEIATDSKCRRPSQ